MSNMNAAIVGIGESRVGSVPDRSALQLQADAAQAALADAGLKMSDIDGLLTTPVRVEHWNMPCGVVAHHLGVKAKFLSTVAVCWPTLRLRYGKAYSKCQKV